MRMWHFREERDRHFEIYLRPNAHITNQERFGSYTAQANVVRLCALLLTNNGIARNATTRCVLPFITLVTLLGGDSWQLIFVNFQIIISAIPVFETALNGELFPPLPPRRGTIGGAHGLGISQAKLLNVCLYQMRLCFHCCCISSFGYLVSSSLTPT